MEVLIFFKPHKSFLSFRRRRNLIKCDSSFVGITNSIKNIVITLTLLLSLSFFGQKTLTQEDKIYNAVDAFVANPSAEKTHTLNNVERAFWKNPTPKTKNELLAIVILNCNKAYYENQLNKVQEAVSSYEKAWKIYQKYRLNNYDIVEYCLKPLGNLYTILGDYDNAENTIKQYYYIANQEKNNPEASGEKIAAILNLSNVYQNSGKIELAIDLLEKTIQTEKLANTQKGILLNNLGNSYLLSYNKTDIIVKIIPNIFEKLEGSYLNAIQLLKSDKTQTETLANCYRNLSSLNSQWQHFDIANSYFEKAKTYFYATPNLSPRKIAKFKYEEASLLFQQQKLNESTAIIESIFKLLIPNYSNKKNSLPEQNSLYTETSLLDALDLRAEIYSKQNQPKKALEAYRLAFHIEELLANMIIYENSKIINQNHVRNRTEKCIVLYEALYQKEQKQTYIEAAFQLAEQSKSGILKNHLLQKKNISRKEKLHIEQLQNWSNTILKEQQKGDLANIEKINEAIQKQNELMLSLKKIHSENTASEKEVIDIKALFSKLEKDKAIMIEYFMGNENLYYFVIGNNTISLNKINITDTAIPKIAQFIDYFNNPNSIINDVNGYNHYGNSLYKMLKLPTKTTYQNLIIIPDGILNFLPFEALITQESNTTNFAQMHYLLNDYNIGYQNSAQFYLASGQSKKIQEKTVLGIFPVFENTPYTLTYSKDELHSIQKNFKGKYLENADATFHNFKENAANYSILHLSTHADAGDVVTPASIKFYDQEIMYSELYHLNINPDLVVLSACETGIGKLYKSEGAMSIARGFQLAGAQNLLFSLWKVNDYTTSVFMDSFYQNIKNGQSYLEANANAKRDFLKNPNISNAKKSPYYWSAFIYYGDLQTTKESNSYIFYIFGILILIGLFLIFNLFRK
ncbi:CHAT domain-containing protein [Flavobacterium undicola]|uniref:CHAT domain-containing protein n=1 Tax=Flavobacterium undicola TaxID=1932779 RepID=UPI0013769676|nr:CHAT domain-containing protein [Flavobacterium undicola]MBA0883026.1 CHAT domain-containing protein [Flavobacterium undicola]